MDGFVKRIFRNKKFDEKKMADFGFKSDGDGFLYTQNIKDDQFELYFRVNSAKDIETSLVDRMSGEPYTLYLVEDAEGTFVGEVREAYESALNEIAANCCNDTYFTCQQSNRITELIYDKYRDTPEFLWEKFPGHGVFRNPLSRKWYGVILRVSGEKLDKKLKSEVEVLNIKLSVEDVQNLLKQRGFYPAYHMNKKSWISILLDDIISDKEIMALIDKSHKFSAKG